MRRTRQSTSLIFLALVLCGILVTLSFAPFGWWPLSLAALAVLNIALEKASPRRGLLLGWAFGAGLFLSGVSWVYVSIHDYGYVAAPLAVVLTIVFCLLLALFPAISAWAYCRWLRGGFGGRVLGFAALFVLVDWVRAWLLTGFPWLYPGYAYIDTPLSGWAPVGGIYLLNLLVYISAACLAQTLYRRQWWLVVGAVAFWALGFSLQQVAWTQPTGERLRIGAVQVNITQDQKWLPGNYRPTLALYDRMTQPLLGEVDVVIWPEAAIPNYYHVAKPFLDNAAAMAESEGTALITGIPYRSPEGVYNAVVVLTGGSGVYAKQRLVPFGEYVPLKALFQDLLDFFNLPISGFTVGPSNQQPLTIQGQGVAPYICYEVVYPDFVVEQINGASMLLTLSNDAWFGRSIGPKQHFQMARMRALETGRPLIRSTGTGITAVVDERGRATDRIPAFEAGILTATVEGFTGNTPFTRFSSLPVLLLCTALVAISFAGRRRF